MADTFLLIGFPFHERLLQPEFMLSCLQITKPMNVTFGYAPCRGLPIDEARNALAETALANGSTYLMMIDSDTAPPSHTLTNLIRILDGNKDVMVAGGIYFSKEKTPQPIVFKEEQKGPTWDWTYGDVFECSSIGTGCMMVKVEVFKHLEKPWFKTDKDNFMTDDIYFCRKVKAAGYKIMADGGVICLHWDEQAKPHGKAYTMSQDDPPVKRFKEKLLNIPVSTTWEFKPEFNG